MRLASAHGTAQRTRREFPYIESLTQPLHVCSILELDTSTVPGGYTFDRLRDELAVRIDRPCRKPIARSPRIARTRNAPKSPRLAIHPMMNAVGGTTLHYWAQSWRLNPWDFKVVSETTRRYGASRIPKGSTVEDWPFGLEELEPYYDKVEYEIGVSGQAGNINGHDRSRAATSSRARARASIRCRRCAAPASPT